jgi:hypothetical protein
MIYSIVSGGNDRLGRKTLISWSEIRGKLKGYFTFGEEITYTSILINGVMGSSGFCLIERVGLHGGLMKLIIIRECI